MKVRKDQGSFTGCASGQGSLTCTLTITGITTAAAFIFKGRCIKVHLLVRMFFCMFTCDFQSSSRGRCADAAPEGATLMPRTGWVFPSGVAHRPGFPHTVRQTGPEADAGWRQVMATRMDGGVLTTRALGPFAGKESLTRALDCAG